LGALNNHLSYLVSSSVGKDVFQFVKKIDDFDKIACVNRAVSIRNVDIRDLTFQIGFVGYPDAFNSVERFSVASLPDYPKSVFEDWFVTRDSRWSDTNVLFLKVNRSSRRALIQKHAAVWQLVLPEPLDSDWTE